MDTVRSRGSGRDRRVTHKMEGKKKPSSDSPITPRVALTELIVYTNPFNSFFSLSLKKLVKRLIENVGLKE